jgi:hypothetical protein
VIAVILGLALFFYLRWENSRRDKMTVTAESSENQEKNGVLAQVELVDTTDLKNMRFRYVY